MAVSRATASVFVRQLRGPHFEMAVVDQGAVNRRTLKSSRGSPHCSGTNFAVHSASRRCAWLAMEIGQENVASIRSDIAIGMSIGYTLNDRFDRLPRKPREASDGFLAYARKLDRF